MRIATGAALLAGFAVGIFANETLQRAPAARAAAAITASQVTSKDTRTAVQIRRDMEK